MDDISGARAPALPQPEPGLDVATLVERAAALRPLLLAQQEESDRRGVYSDEVHEAFRQAGFYRILQPRMFGGYELPPSVFLKVVMQIARGHPAAAWCFTLTGSHGYFIASHYPEVAQRELFGPQGEFRSPQVVGPAGTMTPVEGGYLVEGVWPFASGVPVATHFMGGSLAPQPDGSVRHVFFAVPRDQVEILPDWGEGRFMGMQASGSNSVRVDKVFVPERMIIPFDMMTGTERKPHGSPGVQLHGNPMYLGILAGWFHCEFGAIMSGAAMAACDAFAELAHNRPILTNPQLKRVHDPFTQLTYATALGKAQSAQALTLAAVGLYEAQCARFGRTGAPITPLDSYEVWGMAREACVMACDAVEILFHAAGASAGRTGNRLQRYFKDIEMYRLHIQNQPTLPVARAQAEFGLPGELFGS